MRLLLRLVVADLLRRPLRLVLTSAATAAAAAMVVWVVSGYDALLDSFDEYSDIALGHYTLSVAPIGHFSQSAPGAIPAAAETYVPDEAVQLLRADPAVAFADPMWAPRVAVQQFVEAGAEPIPERGLPDVRPVGTDAPEPPFELLRGRWIDPAAPDRLDAVISVEGAEGYGLDVGGSIVVGPPESAKRLRIVGVVVAPRVSGWSATVAKQQMLTPGVGGLFVPKRLLEAITGQRARTSFVGVGLRPDTDITQFRFTWATRLGAFATPCQFQEAHDIEEALDESAAAENVAEQSRMATLVAMAAALFIIFSTLNMGVAERARQLALLRAVALTRGQVGLMIAMQGLLFAAIGFVVGTLAGWGLLALAMRSAPELLEDGARIGMQSVSFAALSAFGGAAFASIPAARTAMRVRPLDAFADTRSEPATLSWPRVVLGLALLGVYPVLAHGIDHPDEAPFVLYMLVGLATLTGGVVVLGPAVVIGVDRLVGPLVARALGIPAELLAQQLSGHLHRTLATALALTVGLGLYIAIQVWGYSLLGGFMPGRWAPEAVIGFSPAGIAIDRAREVDEIPGVTRSFPIVVEQPRLAEDLTNSAERATVVRQDNVVLVGISPDALVGSDPLLAFEWVEGDREQAIAQLRSGRGCIVPDHFLREARLRVGDDFALVPPADPQHPVTYTIVGAVEMSGWHWQTKPTGFRTRTHRAAALVFAGYDVVARDFSFAAASHVWLDYDPTQTDGATLASAAQALYRSVLGRDVGLDDAVNDRPYVRVVTIEHIRELVRSHARQWLWAMSRLPLVILLITSIGVLNTMLASVHARRWELGVMRAVGYMRGTIVRLVVAEGVLIGVIAVVLSLVFGAVAGFCGAGMSRYQSFFGGMTQEPVMPWATVLPAIGGAVVLTCAVALWPALAIAHTEPLRLLRRGRDNDD